MSKKMLDENKPKFPLLPQDDYILKVEKIEFVMQKKYESNEEEKAVNITFDIVSFRDGEPAKDVDGGDTSKRKMFLTSRYDEENNIGLGFMTDGTPSKLRQFIAYTTGQDVLEDLVWEWEDLKGKTVIAEITQYLNQKGEKSNKISRFIHQRKKGKVADDGIPVVEDGEVDIKDIPF